ncbi:MAG: hypothetical protein ACI8TX_000374 [Hyphomicrobiaceae bacterium]|jgi:hypothetical protein
MDRARRSPEPLFHKVTGAIRTKTDRLRRHRPTPYRETSDGAFSLNRLGPIELRGRLGEGGCSNVYRGLWDGRDVAVKLHKSDAVERHIRKGALELAEYEYGRNRAFYEAPGLKRYVACPIAYNASSSLSVLVQEWLEGSLYYFWHKDRGGVSSPRMEQHLQAIVDGAHAAGLYDIDFHAMNVIVVEEDGEPIPKLFDFNYVPSGVHARNPFVAIGLRLGIIDPRSRDLRMLKTFHDFSREERQIRKYYPLS